MGGYFLEHANFEPANPLQTPEHIAPVWYFTPFYAILRAVPNKLLGVVLMGSAVLLLVLPAVARPLPVKSIRYRSWIFKVGADGVRDQLRGARLPRPAAGDRRRARCCRWSSRSSTSRSSCSCRSTRASRRPSRCRTRVTYVRNAVIALVLRRSALAGAARRAQHEADARAGEQRHRQHGVAAARREVLRELLPGLPLGEVRALQPPRAKTCSSPSSSSSTT